MHTKQKDYICVPVVKVFIQALHKETGDNTIKSDNQVCD